MRIAKGALLVSLCSWLMACGGGGNAPNATTLADGAVALESPSGDVVIRVLRIPPEDADRPSLIVGLHGYGMDEQQIASLVNIEPTTPHAYVAIRGFEQIEPRGHAWFPLTASTSGVNYSPEAVAAAGDRLFWAIAAIGNWLHTDPDRVYIVGFSQGAAISLAASLLRPEDAAGFVGFAGALPVFDRAELPTTAVPVLIGHGSRDPSIRAESTDLSVARLIEAGRHVELKVYAVPHVVSAAGRRDIAQWIDDRDAGVEMTATTPEPLSATGVSLANNQGSPEALVDAVLERAVRRGGVSGNPEGNTTVYKFFDYNCPSCRIAHRELPSLLEVHPDVRLVAVDVPVFGDRSVRASALTFSIENADSYKATYSELLASEGVVGAQQALSVIRKHTKNPMTESDISNSVDAYRAEFETSIAAMNVLGIVGTP